MFSIFQCAYWLFVYLWRILCSNFHLTLNRILLLLSYSSLNVLVLVPYQMICRYFFPYPESFFPLSIVYICLCTKVFNFDEAQLVYLFFIDCTFWVLSKKSWRFSPTLAIPTTYSSGPLTLPITTNLTDTTKNSDLFTFNKD